MGLLNHEKNIDQSRFSEKKKTWTGNIKTKDRNFYYIPTLRP